MVVNKLWEMKKSSAFKQHILGPHYSLFIIFLAHGSFFLKGHYSLVIIPHPDALRSSNFFCFRDHHAFDASDRKGKKQRKSKRMDISKPNEASRGCLPIRSHHKCDESKILATTKLGCPDSDHPFKK